MRKADDMNEVTMVELAEVTRKGMEEAKALPFTSYRDRGVFELEKAKIFYDDWICICSEKELSRLGDYFAFALAEEPLMLVRGDDGLLRAMGNICRHRGTVLNDEGFGNTPKMVCPYHAWTYNLQGECVATPYATKGEIDKQCHHLSQFSVEVWNELVFVNMGDNPSSLQQRFVGLEKYFQAFGAERFTETYGRNMGEGWSANWKLIFENAIESYHLFKVHSSTLEEVTPTREAYYLETTMEWTVTGGKMLEEKNSLFSWLSSSSKEKKSDYVLIAVPPSFVGILTYDSFDWMTVLPVNQTESIVRVASRRESGYSLSAEEEQFLATFLQEDKDICERVQSGMTATHSIGGYLLEVERIVVDFHNYLSRRLFQSERKRPLVSENVNQFFE